MRNCPYKKLTISRLNVLLKESDKDVKEGDEKKKTTEVVNKDQPSKTQGDDGNKENDDGEKLECKSTSSVIFLSLIKLTSFCYVILIKSFFNYFFD